MLTINEDDTIAFKTLMKKIEVPFEAEIYIANKSDQMSPLKLSAMYEVIKEIDLSKFSVPQATIQILGNRVFELKALKVKADYSNEKSDYLDFYNYATELDKINEYQEKVLHLGEKEYKNTSTQEEDLGIKPSF